ncbi:hypothetical protein HAX54_022439 [Datura stramonium]|uniref:FAD-binding domain-containing protein n=1 Tax=Datura stramonium TaxID=4076 RepID=A0ABS8UU81_DATST|nr:hypothetical protein [Datura stramonium]
MTDLIRKSSSDTNVSLEIKILEKLMFSSKSFWSLPTALEANNLFQEAPIPMSIHVSRHLSMAANVKIDSGPNANGEWKKIMETEENIVIVGAGIAGLATCLALHRLGLRSIVLESADSLRATGFALALWTNAWRALDALGIGDSLRQRSLSITGFKSFSADSGAPIKEVSLVDYNHVEYESRCVRRKDLLEQLANELPQGAIRYSSKVDSIEESGPMKLVHLADGSTIRTKALIGCDGVNSVVANWLGLQKPVYSGRSAIRGFVEYPEKHGYQPKFHAYFGGGVRFGFLPSDEKSLYWFCTFTPSVVHFDGNAEQDPIKLKQFVLNKAINVSKELSTIIDRTTLDCISCAQLKLRLPWNVLLGNILRNNVCVVGDALHPMTPDLGQGGCSALEDSIVIAKCLGEALIKPTTDGRIEQEDEFMKIRKGLEKYAKERRWRSFTFISAAYLSGFIQESGNKLNNYVERSKHQSVLRRPKNAKRACSIAFFFLDPLIQSPPCHCVCCCLRRPIIEVRVLQSPRTVIQKQKYSANKGRSVTVDSGKKKILLLKGKEKGPNVSGGSLAQQNVSSSLRNSPTLYAPKQNQRQEASGRIIRSILLKDARQNQLASQLEHQIQDKDNRPPQPPNMQLFQKDTSGADEDKLVGNDMHVVHIEKQERRSRHRDRPDRGVWAPLRRADSSQASNESLSSSTPQSSQVRDFVEGLITRITNNYSCLFARCIFSKSFDWKMNS